MFDKLFVKKNKLDGFWDWFNKNSDTYYHFEKNQNSLFNQLKSELNKIDSNLVFEFSPILQNGKRELVISADGIKSTFPIVNELVNCAPKFSKWDIIAFRQPRKGITQVKYADIVLNFEDVFFSYEKNDNQIDLELHIRGFYESTEWTIITFILLDNLLGEYYTEMSLNRIEKKNLNEEQVKNLYPISDLHKIIENYFNI